MVTLQHRQSGSQFPDFYKTGITKVLLITSGYHMRRALACGRLIFGIYGISIDSIVAPPLSDRHHQNESILRAVRDGLRALVWICTGITGECVTLWKHPKRKHACRPNQLVLYEKLQLHQCSMVSAP